MPFAVPNQSEECIYNQNSVRFDKNQKSSSLCAVNFKVDHAEILINSKVNQSILKMCVQINLAEKTTRSTSLRIFVNRHVSAVYLEKNDKFNAHKK